MNTTQVAETVTLADILAEVRRLAGRHQVFLVLVCSAIAIGYSVMDLMGATTSNTFAGITVTVFVQFAVMERLLGDRLHADRGEKRRYWSLFGAGVLSGLGILLGLLMLVLPGAYLAGRWISSSAYVVAEGKSAFEALGSSWEQSEPSQFAHVAAAVLSILPTLGFLILMVAEAYGILGLDEGVLIIVSNVLVATGTLLVWLFGAATYCATHRGRSELRHVFA